jgi:putative photosynthetic complex assembly protein
MHAPTTSDEMPRGALIGAALLLGFSLLAATAARLLHLQVASPAHSVPVRVLHLSFVDRADGAVAVLDADHGYATIHIVPAGTNGFLRGVLRGLARARRNEHVGQAPPFTLTRWADGQMTLADPQTGQRVSLEVFGPSNSRPFAQLLIDDKEPLP